MSEGTPGGDRRPGALARTPIKELQRQRQAQEQEQQHESLFMTQPSQDEREAAQRAAAAPESPVLRTSPRNAAGAAAARGGPQSTPVAARGSAVKRARDELAGTPRRSPVKQAPRAAAAERPPGPEVDLGIANPFVKRGLRRSPPLGVPAGTAAPAPDVDPQPTDRAAAINLRAQERLQRLRGAQTRSPGIGVSDFDFALPPPAPQTALMTVPVAPSPLAQAQTSAAPAESTTPAGPPPRRSIGIPGQSNPAPPAPTVAAPAAPTPAAAEPSLAAAQTPSFLMQQGGDSSIPAPPATPTPAAPPTRRTEQWLPAGQLEERPPKSPGHRPRARQEEQEPELPPTPTQRGIADPTATTPSTGIHNTPNKKRRTAHRSSPLKPRDPPPAQSQSQQRSRASSREGEPPEEPEPQPKRHKAAAPTSRFSTPTDPNATKKRKRDRMFAEIAQLEADIKLAEKENTRLQKYANNPSLAPKRPANVDAVVEMLARTMASPPTFEEPPKFRENVFDKISSFLPFSRRPKPKKTEMAKPETLPSVLPLEVGDPLPFLSVFTPFKFRSTITSLPPAPGPEEVGPTTADILQLHSISTIAPLEPCLSKINVTVNTTNGSVMRLEVEHMDSAATLELGAWVAKRGKQGVLGRDVNAVFWAQGAWYENAVRRARFWCLVEGEMGTREGKEKVRTRLRARAKRARGGQVEVEEEEERNWTKWELRRHFKEQQVGIDVDGVKVVISWKIVFDWTGEAESLVTCEVKPNKTFLEVDERESLRKVGDIFNGMVREQSPIEAARAVVVQLMGDI